MKLLTQKNATKTIININVFYIFQLIPKTMNKLRYKNNLKKERKIRC